ncbi:hypothetical protein IAD21_03742 [Abditibacteriota bacterium]|nr:hypothetical protein IAD21_03742 [Abditibacteriota bacterium]
MNLSRSLLVLCLGVFAVSLPLHAATVHGSVLGPGNKPIVGATVLVLTPASMKAPIKTLSGADGKWTAEIPDSPGAADVGPSPDFVGALIVAPGQGFGAKLGKKSDSFDILLPTPTTISGIVKDEKGTPVAGVELRIKGFYSTMSSLPTESRIPFDLGGDFLTTNSTLPIISTKSDAQGKWHFDGIPLGMKVFLSLADDRFSASDIDVRAGDTDAVVTPQIGASVKGRVLLPDGKPAAGIQIFSTNGMRPTTDAQGRFSLTQLPKGDTTLRIFDIQSRWLPVNQSVTALQASETRDIGDIKLSAGIQLKGQVVDDSGKGIDKATVIGNGERAETGPDGRFQMRGAPGKMWITASKAGFLGTQDNAQQVQQQVDVAPDETQHTLAPLKLQRGVYISGTARDEAGQPAVGVKFNAGAQWENPATAVVEKDGTFRFGPLAPGKQVTMHAEEAWDLIKEEKVTAPTLIGEAAAPRLSLTVKKIVLTPVKGRVVTPEGAPLANVSVHYRIYNGGQNDSWSGGEVSSDDKGLFSFGALRPEQTPGLDSVTSDTYVLVKSTPATREGESWSLGDVIVSPLDGHMEGQILDGAGAPAEGAKIALAGHYPVNIVTADADGRFILDKLPHGEATLLVAKDHSFVRQTVKVGPDVRITLENRAAPTQSDAEQLLRTKADSLSPEEASQTVPSLAPDAALSLLKKGGDGAPDPASVALFVAALAHRDARTASTWGVAQWDKLPNEKRTVESGTVLARALVPLNRDFAVQWLATARGKIKPTDFSANAASNYMALAGLAGALGDPSAPALLDLALTAADQSVAGERKLEEVDGWGRAAATTPELADRLTQDLEPQEEVRALAGAIQTLAPTNIDAAESLLTRLKAARENPVVKAADARQETERHTGGNWHETSSEVLAHAQLAIALALASHPGPAALDMAKGIGEEYRRGQALFKVARRHLEAGRTVEAADALRAFMAVDTYSDTSMSKGAGMALTFDKTLANEIFAKDHQRVFNSNNNYSNDYVPTAAGYAFYHAPLDAGESRLILENEWEWRRAAKARQGNENDNYDWQLRPILLAMGALDLPRALEMMGQIKDKYHQNDELKSQIALSLLTKGQVDLFDLGQDEDDF